MSFKQTQRTLPRAGLAWLMVLGIVALCQPWSLILHRYGVTIILVGLVGFIDLRRKIKPAAREGADGHAWPRSSFATSRSTSAQSTSSASST